MSQSFGRFFESLVLASPRPYQQRAAIAQRRVAELLQALGNPHHDLPCLHVAGSKGKGSTALFAEAILVSAGIRTGTFTSPHLNRWTERFRVDGAEVDADRLEQLIATLAPHVDSLTRRYPDSPPTFFDVMTALALLVFRNSGVRFGIIETGIGGRLDATRIVAAVSTCLTNVELEHTDKLGHSLTAIAREKAGIIRAGIPLVIGKLDSRADAVVSSVAREAGARVARLGVDFLAAIDPQADTTRLQFSNAAISLEVELETVGEHLARNAALAIETVHQTGILAPHSLVDAARAGLPGTALPGRTEIYWREPLVVIDAAHTVSSAEALADVLTRVTPRVHLVLSMTAGKNVVDVCKPLMPFATRVTATCAEPSRSMRAELLADCLRAQWPAARVSCIPNPTQAIHSALAGLERNQGLCITGSVYAAGAAHTALPARRGEQRSGETVFRGCLS